MIDVEASQALMDKIGKVCSGNPKEDVVTALWLTLLEVIMQTEGCTVEQAIKVTHDLGRETGRYEFWVPTH